MGIPCPPPPTDSRRPARPIPVPSTLELSTASGSVGPALLEAAPGGVSGRGEAAPHASAAWPLSHPRPPPGAGPRHYKGTQAQNDNLPRRGAGWADVLDSLTLPRPPADASLSTQRDRASVLCRPRAQDVAPGLTTGTPVCQLFFRPPTAARLLQEVLQEKVSPCLPAPSGPVAPGSASSVSKSVWLDLPATPGPWPHLLRSRWSPLSGTRTHFLPVSETLPANHLLKTLHRSQASSTSPLGPHLSPIKVSVAAHGGLLPSEGQLGWELARPSSTSTLASGPLQAAPWALMVQSSGHWVSLALPSLATVQVAWARLPREHGAHPGWAGLMPTHGRLPLLEGTQLGPGPCGRVGDSAYSPSVGLRPGPPTHEHTHQTLPKHESIPFVPLIVCADKGPFQTCQRFSK
uniref:uncharacterized protein LOC103792149 n=1 Tax=Callithrix jacchus TaxID=9483 RepID=UPI00159F6527|nr:uncharacterized protein LOC103792149 [Callithrix jacchus]